MPYTEWINGEPVERLTEEERKERKEAMKAEKRNKKKRVDGEIPKYIKGRKEGMDLEKRIAKKWNNSLGTKKKKTSNMKKRPSLELEEQEDELVEEKGIKISKSFSTKTPTSTFHTGFETKAKRQPNSGAMWYAKGDITLSHALMEVKERGTVNGRGEKTISIPKSWLTKQADEAFQERRHYWYLAFAYKNDEEIYIIKPYDHEIEMVQRIEELGKENALLKEKLKEVGAD